MSELRLDAGNVLGEYCPAGGDGAAVTAWAEAAGVSVREVVSWMGGAQSADWYHSNGGAPLFGAADGAVDVTSFLSGLLAVPAEYGPAVGAAAAAAGAVAVPAVGSVGDEQRGAKAARVEGGKSRRPGVKLAAIALVVAVAGLTFSVLRTRPEPVSVSVVRPVSPPAAVSVGPSAVGPSAVGPGAAVAPGAVAPGVVAPGVVVPGVVGPTRVAVDAAVVRGAIVGVASKLSQWGRGLVAAVSIPRLADPAVAALRAKASVAVATQLPAAAAAAPVARRAVQPAPVAVVTPKPVVKPRGLELADLPVLPEPVARPYYGNPQVGPAPVIRRAHAFKGLPDTLQASAADVEAMPAAGH